jgi:hypothetical protein
VRTADTTPGTRDDRYPVVEPDFGHSSSEESRAHVSSSAPCARTYTPPITYQPFNYNDLALASGRLVDNIPR